MLLFIYSEMGNIKVMHTCGEVIKQYGAIPSRKENPLEAYNLVDFFYVYMKICVCSQ